MRNLVRFIAAAVAAFIISALLFHAPKADAVQVEKPTHHVKHLKVSYAEEMDTQGRGRFFVELNDGSAYYLRGCRTEGSRHCVWNAQERGNKQAHSFVRVRKHIFFLN